MTTAFEHDNGYFYVGVIGFSLDELEFHFAGKRVLLVYLDGKQVVKQF